MVTVSQPSRADCWPVFGEAPLVVSPPLADPLSSRVVKYRIPRISSTPASAAAMIGSLLREPDVLPPDGDVTRQPSIAALHRAASVGVAREPRAPVLLIVPGRRVGAGVIAGGRSARFRPALVLVDLAARQR